MNTSGLLHEAIQQRETLLTAQDPEQVCDQVTPHVTARFVPAEERQPGGAGGRQDVPQVGACPAMTSSAWCKRR